MAVQFNTGGTDYGRWPSGDLISTTGGYIDSSVFTDYISPGTFNSTINSDISAAISTWTGVETDSNNKLPAGKFSARVIYEYQVVPEPAAIGLGGILTLTISRIRRRKQVISVH